DVEEFRTGRGFRTGTMTVTSLTCLPRDRLGMLAAKQTVAGRAYASTGTSLLIRTRSCRPVPRVAALLAVALIAKPIKLRPAGAPSSGCDAAEVLPGVAAKRLRDAARALSGDGGRLRTVAMCSLHDKALALSVP